MVAERSEPKDPVQMCSQCSHKTKYKHLKRWEINWLLSDDAYHHHLSPSRAQAFQMIDQDKDGFISKNDIRQTFDSLGK